MPVAGPSWVVECTVADVEVGHLVHRFEWKSMVNGGYIARARVADPYFTILHDIFEKTGNNLLRTARQFDRPTLMSFKLKWSNGIEGRRRTALVTEIHAVGDDGFSGFFDFIAIDPISYYINSGDASGKAYHGRIGGDDGVVAQVIRDYVPNNIRDHGVKIIVGDTNDQPNTYWMMRQDPKTFITSLLEWSSPFTEHQTAWEVANGEDEDGFVINISESWEPNLEYPTTIPGDEEPFIMSYGGVTGAPTPNISKWEMLTDHLLSAFDLKLVTSGMSSTSGRYFDRVLDSEENKVFVRDENTQNKLNPRITESQGFTKPKRDDRGWTHIMSVPEVYSGGDIGMPYGKYVDGRARQQYMEMLDLLMRIRVTVRGQPRLYDSAELGRTKTTLRWLRIDEESGGSSPRFIDGDWLLCGWDHILRPNGKWDTDLYLSRLDYNAKAVPGAR